MNFLKAGVSRENGHTRVAIGGQGLQAPAAVADSGEADVLVGIRAEYIQASHPDGATTEGFDADTLVVEPLGSHLLITASVGDQLLKVVTRADFDAQPGQRLRLQPEMDKMRWLRASDGASIGV
jgi:multiple sugar transport system ATP-binding protein